jgi:hypothetical protein
LKCGDAEGWKKELGPSHEKSRNITKIRCEREYCAYKNIRRKADWIGHILHGNRLLKHVIEEKVEGGIEVKARRGRKREQLLDDLKDTRSYWQMKGEALNRYRLWTYDDGTGQSECRHTV